MKEKIIIIGAGIIGMLSARLLSKAGLEVVVLEQSYAGTESSWAGGGIISPLYPWRYQESITRLSLWGQENYPRLLADIKDESGCDPEYVRNGLLYLDVEQELATAKNWMQQHDYGFEEMEQQQLALLEPELNELYTKSVSQDSINKAWLSKAVAQVRNPRLVRALKKAIQLDPNISLCEQTAMQQLLVENHQVKGVKTNQGNFFADKVIIAGGAWSAKLLEQYAYIPKISPVKGQMIVFKAPANLVKHIILSKERYIIPRKDGHIVIGSTLEFNQFDKSTDEKTLHQLRMQAIRLIPSLANYPVVKQWAGLRPGSIDGIPFIGEHPEIENVYLNAGHFRNGVVIGYASCQLLKNILLREKPIVDPTPYQLSKERASETLSSISLEGAI